MPTYEAAQIYEGIIRHIEYVSNAQQAYANATYCQVMGGIGYWRVLVDYMHDDTFDQEIYIKRIADPTQVYLDPGHPAGGRQRREVGLPVLRDDAGGIRSRVWRR
jgi:hypothetical protein